MDEIDPQSAVDLRDQLRSLVGGAENAAVQALYLSWIAELEEKIAGQTSSHEQTAADH